MGKNIKISAMLIVIMAVSTPAFSQGWNYKAGKDCWQLAARAGVTMTPEKQILPYGEFELIRSFRNSNWQAGVVAYGFYSDQLVPGVDLTFGYELGNEHAGVRLYALGGLGAANHKVEAENTAYEGTLSRKQLKPEVGVGLSGYVSLGSIALTANVRYAHQLNMEYGKTSVEGMTVTSESWESAQLVASLGVAYNICRQTQYNGDRCMQAKASYMFSKDALATVGADWFFRIGSNWMMFFGTEFGMTTSENLSSAVVELGTQYLIFDKRHADAWMLPTVALQAGIGEQSYQSFATTATNNETPWSSATFTTQQGLEVGGYAGFHILPLKAFHVENKRGELEVGIGYKVRTTFTSDPSFTGEAVGTFKKVEALRHGLTMSIAYTF